MIGVILCLWFNRSMLSPSSKSPQRKFRRVTLVGKHQAGGIDQHLRELAQILVKQGCEVTIEASTASHLKDHNLKVLELQDFKSATDLAVILGGDGTMLRAAEVAQEHNIPLLGVNLGHVGFLSEVERSKISDVINALVNKSYVIDPRITLGYS
ncbi:MAG: hypothetical protein EBW80_08540, partial [Burkholderiaceae bacterium]|nr:hypothetical protein [Burkholderiaceae bacterium]